MSDFTHESALALAKAVTAIELTTGQTLYVRPLTGWDVHELQQIEGDDTDKGLVLLSRMLANPDGSPLFGNGNGLEKIRQWPLYIIQELNENKDIQRMNGMSDDPLGDARGN